ncbi:hypothetical protein Lal_00033604, partial [Lupinus albus]
CMTMRNTGPLHSINFEIDRTYHRLVRQNRIFNSNFVSVSKHPVFVHSVHNSDYVHFAACSMHSVAYYVHYVAFSDSNHSVHFESMAQPPTPPSSHERTLRELAAPYFTYDSLCIQYEDVSYVLKTRLIHLLPKFHGLVGPLQSERTSMELGSNMYFYDGLNNMDRSIIYIASGGALGDMTPFEAKSLIEKMASNSKQFNARSDAAVVVRGVHDVGTNAATQDKLKSKIDSLTTLVTQLAMNNKNLH